MRRVVLAACDEDRSPVAFARAVAPLLDATVRLVNIRSSSGITDAEPDTDAPVVFAGAHIEHAASAAAGLQRLIATDRPVLTVLGSAHDAAHGRVRVGGTAERVLHGAASAVAVVPRGHGERPLGTVGVGLLPTTDSRRALRFAAALASAAHAPLLVLTVLRRSPDPADAARFAARLAPPPPRSGAASEATRRASCAPRSRPPHGKMNRASRSSRWCWSAIPSTRCCARPDGSGCSCSGHARTGRPGSCCRAGPRAERSPARAARSCSCPVPISPPHWRSPRERSRRPSRRSDRHLHEPPRLSGARSAPARRRGRRRSRRPPTPGLRVSRRSCRARSSTGRPVGLDRPHALVGVRFPGASWRTPDRPRQRSPTVGAIAVDALPALGRSRRRSRLVDVVRRSARPPRRRARVRPRLGGLADVWCTPARRSRRRRGRPASTTAWLRPVPAASRPPRSAPVARSRPTATASATSTGNVWKWTRDVFTPDVHACHGPSAISDIPRA